MYFLYHFYENWWNQKFPKNGHYVAPTLSKTVGTDSHSTVRTYTNEGPAKVHTSMNALRNDVWVV